VDPAAVAQAYGVAPGASLDNLAQKLAAAELMIRGGTNVVTMIDASGWDTHGDGPTGSNGKKARDLMTSQIMPALKIFLARTQSDPDLKKMNITVMIHGDFARSLPGSDHAPVLSSLVIGPNVKVGTTGRVAPDVTLPVGTGASKEMWSYLAALAKVKQNPFGPNPHNLVL
jgi:uncharacterized protein (DUF1501 family)